MYYHFKVHKGDDGYWAQCIELEGCRTQGDTLSELKENAKDALDLFLSEPAESDVLFVLPKKVSASSNIFEVHVEPSIAFALLLKYHRTKQKMTQQQAAKKMGMGSVWSYQKLESPKGANPTLSTLSLVASVFPDLKLDKII